jgi:hypothetical protein
MSTDKRVRAVAGPYLLARSDWRRLYATSFRAILLLPGSLAKKGSILRRLNLWSSCLIATVVILGATASVILFFGGGVAGLLHTWLAVLPFITGGLLAVCLWVWVAYSATYTFGGYRRFILCDPGVAIMAVSVSLREPGQEPLVLEPKNFLAVNRGSGAATPMVLFMQANILKDGNITLETNAQNVDLAEHYYVAKLNFRRGKGKRIYFP